jgi:hypothetical protein
MALSLLLRRYFTPAVGMWTLVVGGRDAPAWSSSLGGQFRVPSPSNVIAARFGHAMAMDYAANRFYVVAGVTTLTGGYIADVMSYDIATNTSTFMAGQAAQSVAPYYPATGKGTGSLATSNAAVALPVALVDTSGSLYWGQSCLTEDQHTTFQEPSHLLTTYFLTLPCVTAVS